MPISDPALWLDNHGDALYRYALLRLRDPMLAEDMVQETLLAAVEALFDRAGHWRIDIRQWSEPDRALEQHEFWRIFTDCIEHLPPRLAVAWMRREFDGLDTATICQELAIGTTNNLWDMLSRARLQLRQCLDAHWFQRKTEKSSCFPPAKRSAFYYRNRWMVPYRWSS